MKTKEKRPPRRAKPAKTKRRGRQPQPRAKGPDGLTERVRAALESYLAAHGISLKKFSDDVGIAHPQMWRFYARGMGLSCPNLDRVADAVGVTERLES